MHFSRQNSGRLKIHTVDPEHQVSHFCLSFLFSIRALAPGSGTSAEVLKHPPAPPLPPKKQGHSNPAGGHQSESNSSFEEYPVHPPSTSSAHHHARAFGGSTGTTAGEGSTSEGDNAAGMVENYFLVSHGNGASSGPKSPFHNNNIYNLSINLLVFSIFFSKLKGARLNSSF